MGASSPDAGAGLGADAVGALFDARSVAVIGASPDFETINGRTLKYLLGYGYRGRIFPVSPRYDEIGGLPCYASVELIPEPVDLAIVSVAAARVPGILAECGAKGIRTAIVYSSGYAELGDEGRRAQQALLDTARRHGIRLCGPNSMGCMNLHTGLMATFSAVLEKPHKAGPLALVSQSGAYGAYILAQARVLGLGFGLFATTGNECDIELGELLEYALRNPETTAALAYVEQLHDADSFARAARTALELDKPLIVIKVGRGVAGARAAASHTGALAGSAEAYDAFFEQQGCVLVDSVEAMLDVALLIQMRSRPRGSRVGIVSMSGGAAVLLGDAAEAAGMTVPELPQATQSSLRELIPFAGVSNPIDATAHLFNAPHTYKGFLDAIVAHDVDVIVLFFGQMIGYVEGLGMRVVRESAAARAGTSKPFVMVGMPGDGEPARVLADGGIPVFVDPSRAIRAIAALARLERRRPMLMNERADTSVISRIEPPSFSMDTEEAAKRWLASSGLQVAEGRVASTLQEALRVADEVGYPVALKVASPDISHKSDVGGVRLGIADSGALQSAHAEILRDVLEACPNARIDGIFVQRMVPAGVELIVGIKRDTIFGPMVVCGIGGTFTELVRDIAIRRAPVSIAEANTMLSQLRGAELLRGFRGQGPADMSAAALTISKVSELAVGASSWLTEMDINPLIVLPEGQGAIVADARIVTG